VSGGWRVANESWWPFPSVNELRLRASEGTAGGRPNFADRFEVFSVGTGGTLVLATLGNERLKPERTRERGFGVDLTTHNRFSVSVVYATQKTEDQLINVPLPRVFGFSSQWLNAGTVEGRSIEVETNFRAIERPGLSWNIGIVADRSRNEITEFDRPCFSTAQQRRCAGEKIGQFVGFQWAKNFDHISNIHSAAARDQFQVNDDGLLVAVGSGNTWQDGVAKELWGTQVEVEGRTYDWGMPISRLDDDGLRSLHINGDGNPDLRFGFNTQVQWRNFQFHALLDGQLGGHIENRTQQRQTQWLRSSLVDQSGKPEHLKKPASYYVAGLYDGNNRNDWWVEPAQHLRVREIALSYRLDPSRLSYLENLGIDNLTLSAAGRNLWVWHKDAFTGWDPVAGSATNASESFGYPAFRTISFRAEVQF
jgi:hypothetical protein